MASSYLNRFPIKKLPVAATPIPVIFLYIIFVLGKKILSLLKSHFSLDPKSSGLKCQQNQEPESTRNLPIRDQEISGDELKVVFEKLGISGEYGDDKVKERYSLKDFVGIFGDDEEGVFDLSEVRDAFDVFDENRDGFIDKKELQRVLCALGMNEGLCLEKCRNMIDVFDENGDGKIDFNEFCKLV